MKANNHPKWNKSSRKSRPRNWPRLDYFTLIRRLIGWLIRWICPSDFAIPDFSFFLDKIQKIHRTRGIKGVISFSKSGRSTLMTLMSSGELERTKTKVLKKRLLPLFGKAIVKKFLKNRTPNNIRMLLTATMVTKALKLPLNPDINSIISPSSEKPGIEKIGVYIKGFWRELQAPKKKGWADSKVTWSKFHFTTKSGPNGHALMGSLSDLYSLPKEMIDSIKFIGGEILSQRIDSLEPYSEMFQSMGLASNEARWPRRLAAIQDKEGKTRVIAIFDYWSQTVLKPVHSFLNGILKRIPQDCTFDQNKLQDRVRGWKNPTYYSIDLTAATDRFPIHVICKVLSGCFSKEFVSHWKNLMVQFSFDPPSHPKVGPLKGTKRGESSSFSQSETETFGQNRNGEIKPRISYKIGNPMGAYSSWASFALAHHYVVYECCIELGIRWSTAQYLLLGDDILIGDTRLGKAYIDKIQILGLEYSPAKTHISNDMFEFAKRISWQGEEITGFNLSSITSNINQYPLMISALSGEERKGFLFTGAVPKAVSEVFSPFKVPRRFKRGILNKGRTCEKVALALQGRVAPQVPVTQILRDGHILNDEFVVKEDVSDDIFRSACVQLFLETQTRFAEGDFGDSFKGLAEYLCDEEVGLANPEFLVDSIPFISIIKEVFEIVEEVKTKTMEVLMHDERLWSFVTAMAVPMNDTVFQMRNHETLRCVSSKLGGKILSVAMFKAEAEGPENLIQEILPGSDLMEPKAYRLDRSHFRDLT